jgi:transcriptional regulator with XRE-family HTH domain
MTNRIQEARRSRGWSQTRLIAEMERVALRRGTTLPSRETLKSRVSRWENGHAKPDDFYRQLLREALGLDDRELGIAEPEREQVATAVDELRAHLATSRKPEPDLLAALACQTEAVRRQDRQYGAGPLLEQMRAHVANVDDHLSYAVFDEVRRAFAHVLADAAALAGWQALDVGATEQSWRLFETASRAAQQADDQEVYAFARMEQAHVLAELATPAIAAEFAVSSWATSRRRVRPALRCWLSAATAEMLAGAGEARRARRMIDTSESLVDTLDGERPPYLVFDATHLRRWIGHSLSLLHDPAAEQQLRQVRAEMDATFTRAGSALHLDLAQALLDRGVSDEARHEIGRAESLARQVGSRRQLERARKLRAAS